MYMKDLRVEHYEKNDCWHVVCSLSCHPRPTRPATKRVLRVAFSKAEAQQVIEQVGLLGFAEQFSDRGSQVVPVLGVIEAPFDPNAGGIWCCRTCTAIVQSEKPVEHEPECPSRHNDSSLCLWIFGPGVDEEALPEGVTRDLIEEARCRELSIQYELIGAGGLDERQVGHRPVSSVEEAREIFPEAEREWRRGGLRVNWAKVKGWEGDRSVCLAVLV